MKDKSRKNLRILFFCALSGVVVVALSVGVLWSKMNRDDRAARVEIQKRLDAIRAAGQPLTAQDLARLYPDPPPEHDAVLLLKPALAELVIPKNSTNLPFFSDEFWPKGNTPLGKPMLDEMQLWMDKNQKAFDSVSLEQLKGAWIGCGYANGFTNLTIAPISKINSLVKLLCLNAVLQAELQHPKETIQSLQKADAIGSTWRNDFPVHGFSKLAAQGWVCETLNRVLNRTAISDSDLISISDSLTSTNLGITKDFIINERCFELFHANQLQSLAKQAKGYAFSPVRLLVKQYQARMIYRDQDLLNYLEWNERDLAALDLPLSNAIPALHKIEHDFDHEMDSLIKKQRNPFNRYFLNTFKKERFSFMSAFERPMGEKMILSEADNLAQVRVTRTTIVIERWRLAHDGKVPDSLNELAPDFLPAIPADPFDDQQLRYKKLSQGYVVYSIGPDFTNDGGKEKPRRRPRGRSLRHHFQSGTVKILFLA
jgi:hypothetical protein